MNAGRAHSMAMRAGALAAVTLLSLTGCGTDGGSSGRSEPITITVATFGEFGYEKLFADYQAQHPGIRIKTRVSDFETHHKSLVTQLAGGAGAADIVAVEEGYMPQLRQSFDKFVDLGTFGARGLQNQYVPWKWEQSLADNGNVVMGLGTDMGSLAMCYRRDHFQAAGLPTERQQVARLWPTWEAYAATGDKFTQVTPAVKWADSSESIYISMLNQSRESYFAESNEAFIGDTNPNVKRAFDTAAGVGAKDQTARVTPFTQGWSAAIKQGTFATMQCPAWMLALIKDAGGDPNKGKWDVTTVPGGGGNQGGSFLTVPKQGAHVKEAADIAKSLVAPAQQKRIFLETGNLPSLPEVYKNLDVVAKKDAYFSNAPVGEIFATAADTLQPNYRGLRDGVVRLIFRNALSRAETKKQSAADAFAEAVQQAKTAIR